MNVKEPQRPSAAAGTLGGSRKIVEKFKYISNYMYSKIACVLIIVATLIFWVIFTFFDKGYSNIFRTLICMGAIVLIVVLGIIISILAVVKERSVLSWICVSAYFIPIIIFASNMGRQMFRTYNYEQEKKKIENIENEHWSSIISSRSAKNQWIPQYLKDENIDVNTQDVENSIPLIAAAQAGEEKLLKWLIEENSAINNQNFAGRSALHQACLCHFSCAKILLENGADVNLMDNEGNTPVLTIVKYWNERQYWNEEYWDTDSSFLVFKELCNYGADLSIENHSGESVFNLLPQKALEKLKQVHQKE